MTVKYPPQKKSSKAWEVFAQILFIVPASGLTKIQLQLGVSFARGMVLTSLKEDSKPKWCSLQYVTVGETIDNILLMIQNNLNKDIKILEGTPFCYIHYGLWICYHKYRIKMEYKEENVQTNIYPQLPLTAPPKNGYANSYSYHLQKNQYKCISSWNKINSQLSAKSIARELKFYTALIQS